MIEDAPNNFTVLKKCWESSCNYL